MQADLVPAYPRAERPGLLGGSSKLAKLAEERRKKAAAAAHSPSSEASKPTSLLDKLGKPQDESQQKENQAPQQRSYPIRRKRSPTPPPKQPEPEPDVVPEEKKGVDLRAGPSSFGQTLARSTHNMSEQMHMSIQDITHLGADTSFFKGPSPDDVVQKAQSQGKGLNK